MTFTQRRRWLLLALLPVAACTALSGREPVIVDVVGVEPLPSKGMEGRFLVKLRVQNPNEAPVEFNGVSVTLDVRGGRLADRGQRRARGHSSLRRNRDRRPRLRSRSPPCCARSLASLPAIARG